MFTDRDIMKRDLCNQNHITLIEIPFWWNGSKADLLQIIQQNSKSMQISL